MNDGWLALADDCTAVGIKQRGLWRQLEIKVWIKSGSGAMVCLFAVSCGIREKILRGLMKLLRIQFAEQTILKGEIK